MTKTISHNAWLKANPVSCARGAPMGCPNDEIPRNTMVRIERLKVDEGYDPSGTYWGCGSREHGWVYAIWSDRGFEPFLPEPRVCIYYWAKSREEARDHAISLDLVPVRH